MSDFPREIRVTLLCKSLPATEEPATVGLQDKTQAVHEGALQRNGSVEFSCVVQVRDKGAGQIDFAGPFVHGTPSARFIYLSWKRAAAAAAPWVQRVKIPLAFTADDLRAAQEIRADITGRKPHATDAIVWTIKPRP